MKPVIVPSVREKQLAAELKQTERKIRTALELLSKMKITTIQTTNHYSIITLENYDKYQGEDDSATNETTNERPSLDQRATTDKEVKKVKNEKKEIVDQEFESFWSAYPKKVAKQDALKAWGQVTPDLQAVLDSLRWQRKQEDWTKDAGKFVPYPATWLRDKRWQDEMPYELQKRQPPPPRVLGEFNLPKF